MKSSLSGRALTETQKRTVVERLLASWLRKPELRLGQLLYCATLDQTFDLFNAEDERLAELVEEFADRL